MVNFSVFNELSLPINSEKILGEFLEILKKLNKNGLKKIRMDKEFSQYPEILPNTSFSQLIGQLKDRDKKTRLRSFINNNICIIESPLIKDEELNDLEDKFFPEYIYNNKSTLGGLVCSYIWNTVAISFNSNSEWDNSFITILKNKHKIDVRNISKLEHIKQHTDFFDELEEELKLNITQENFWQRKTEFFKKIQFVKEIKDQIRNLDKNIFKQAISILRDLETGKKILNNFDFSPEGETVRKNQKLKAMRELHIDGKKYFFENHIKNLPNGYRIYFLEKNSYIYIGYIGKHLKTKK